MLNSSAATDLKNSSQVNMDGIAGAALSPKANHGQQRVETRADCGDGHGGLESQDALMQVKQNLKKATADLVYAEKYLQNAQRERLNSLQALASAEKRWGELAELATQNKAYLKSNVFEIVKNSSVCKLDDFAYSAMVPRVVCDKKLVKEKRLQGVKEKKSDYAKYAAAHQQAEQGLIDAISALSSSESQLSGALSWRADTGRALADTERALAGAEAAVRMKTQIWQQNQCQLSATEQRLKTAKVGLDNICENNYKREVNLSRKIWDGRIGKILGIKKTIWWKEWQVDLKAFQDAKQSANWEVGEAQKQESRWRDATNGSLGVLKEAERSRNEAEKKRDDAKSEFTNAQKVVLDRERDVSKCKEIVSAKKRQLSAIDIKDYAREELVQKWVEVDSWVKSSRTEYIEERFCDKESYEKALRIKQEMVNAQNKLVSAQNEVLYRQNEVKFCQDVIENGWCELANKSAQVNNGVVANKTAQTGVVHYDYDGGYRGGENKHAKLVGMINHYSDLP